jgi:geranylgeranylglycerol-phosphate geranylgeranyltransferase
MAAVAVLVGAFIARGATAWGPAAAGAAAAFAAAGAANALNDALDAAPDAVNRPERPVPSGRLSVAGALWTSAACSTAALALAALAGSGAVALVLAWLVLMALYSAVLKGVPFAGNAAVAVVAATPFLMGGVSQGDHGSAVVPSGLAFLVHLAREVVKDVEDVEGDGAAGVGTFAVRRGPGAGLAVARGILVVLIGAAAVPFALRLYGWGYAVVVLVMDVVIIRLMVRMRGRAPERGARLPSEVLKAVMALGLVAFIAGVLTR